MHLAGQTATFQGEVLSDTLDAGHEAYFFIKDFAGDYSTSILTYEPIVGAGPFSFSVALDPGLGRHVQYGFQIIGPNCWSTDVPSFGSIVVATVPEPASLLLVLAAGLIMRRPLGPRESPRSRDDNY